MNSSSSTIQTESTSGLMWLVYNGRQKSSKDTPKPTKEDQCSQLVNLVAEMAIENKPLTDTDFLVVILDCFEITEEEFANHKKRKRELVYARQVHMYIRHRYFRLSYSQAGEIYGKDHATAMHAERTVLNLMQTDKAYREKTHDIWQLWKTQDVPLPKHFNPKWL